jgi:hypothetical protein
MFRRYVLGAAVALAASGFAVATTINVDSSSGGSKDGSGCTLRDAIQAVNTRTVVGQCPAGSGPVDTINIASAALTFSEADAHSAGAVLPALVAGREVNIQGKAISRTTLTAPGCSNMLPIYSWRLLEIDAGAAASITDVDFTKGCPAPTDALQGSGGAIANLGTLYLTRSRLFQNDAIDATNSHCPAYCPGGAVYNGPEATFAASQVTFEANTGDGALYVDVDSSAYASVDHATFTQSTGSAVHNLGTLIASNVTFFNNQAVQNYVSGTYYGLGGAIQNSGGAYLDLSFATFSDNSLVDYSDTWTSEVDFAAGSTASIRSVLFATPVDGISSENCSIAAGSASIAWSGTSICADDTCAGGSNLVYAYAAEFLDTTLADNGGPTQTLKLLPGNAAFGRDLQCVDVFGDPVPDDQRGLPRPARHCDVGAFNDTVFFHGFDD